MRWERLDRMLETGLLVLLVAVFIFGPLATGAVRPQDFLIIQLLTAAALMLWGVRLWTNTGSRILWPPVAWLVLAFTAYAAIRAGQADLAYIARRELVHVVVYAALFLLVLNHLRRQTTATLLVYVLAALGTLTAAYAVYQFAAKSDHVWWFVRPDCYSGRGSGTYICPNHLAGFLAVVLPLAMSLTVGGRTPVLGRVFLGYSVLMMAAGLAVTLSRGGWIAALAGTTALVGFQLRQRRLAWQFFLFLGLLAGALVFAAGKSVALRERASSLVNERTPGDSFEVRASLARSTFRMWRDHFWWGVGPGHFDYRFPQYREKEVQGRPGWAHNDYLNAAADWGTAGAALILATLVLTAFAVARVQKYVGRDRSDLTPRSSDRWALVTGATAGLVSILVHSWVDFNMQVPANAILVILLIALIHSHLRFTSDRFWIGSRRSLKYVGAVLALGVAAWLIHEGWPTAWESWHLERADREKRLTPTRFQALRQAALIRPDNFETCQALGEAYRQLSWQGHPGYEKQARDAIPWFEQAARLNPYDPYNRVRIGMCLDWLGQHAEALPFYTRALELDPQNHHLCILRGWHAIQIGQYLDARRWFHRSIQLYWWPNTLGWLNLQRVENLIKQQADKPPPPPPSTPPPAKPTQ